MPWPDGNESTLTIDEKALDNLQARHNIAPEMLLQLECTGERVDRARLVGARDRELLNEAVPAAPSAATLNGPTIRAYYCATCRLWITGQPLEQACSVCGEAIT